MTQEEKIISGLDKELMQLIDAEMNDPVIGKLLNRNAAYVLGKEIKLVLIERACDWLEENIDSYLSSVIASLGYSDYVLDWNFINDFKKAMKGE